MRKASFYAVLVALTVMGTAQESMAQQRRTAVKRTVAKKTVAMTQPAISVNFKGDLGQWALRGPVKSYAYDFDTIYFNRDGYRVEKNGKLLSSNAEDRTTVQRDSKGRILSIKDDNFDQFTKYQYNANGLLTQYYWERYSRKLTKTYTYNSKGELTKMVWKETGGPQDGTLVRTYTIQARDSYGNWTKRKAQEKNNTSVEECSITYYEDNSQSVSPAAVQSEASAPSVETTCPLVGDWYGTLGNGWGETTVFLQADKKTGVNSKMAKRLSNGSIDMADDEFIRERNYNLVFNRTLSADTYEFTVQRMEGKQLKSGKLQIKRSGDSITMTGLDAWTKQQPFHGKTLGKSSPVFM